MQLHTSDPNLSTLIDRIDKGRIDLQPDFQRGEVWSLKKRQRLIDTLLRDWHVPPIHLVKRDSPGEDLLEVLDGQQRLSSIWGFVNNEFPVDGTSPPVDERLWENHGKYWSELTERLRNELLDRTIRVLTISKCQPAEAAELFYRLNQPTSLTAPEQRNAYFGRARDQVRNIVREMISMGAEAGLVGFSNARMAYDDIVSKCLMTLDLNSFDKKLTAGLIADKYRSGDEFSGRSVDLVKNGLILFLSATRSSPSSVRFNKASSFSWIIFFARLSSYINISECEKFVGFVPYFYHLGEAHSRSPLASYLVNTFGDRATSRVSDISSVKIRDFCINAIFSMENNLGGNFSEILKLDEIQRLIPQMDKALAADNTLPVSQIVDYLNWGRQLLA